MELSFGFHSCPVVRCPGASSPCLSRHRTAEDKATCSLCSSHWCPACLALRMGEDYQEVRDSGQWALLKGQHWAGGNVHGNGPAWAPDVRQRHTGRGAAQALRRGQRTRAQGRGPDERRAGRGRWAQG